MSYPALHGIKRHGTVVHGTVVRGIAGHGTSVCGNAVNSIALHFAAMHDAVWNCTSLHSTESRALHSVIFACGKSDRRSAVFLWRKWQVPSPPLT